MVYRTIALHVTDEPALDAMLGLTRALAERHAAKVAGVHVSEFPYMPLGFGEAAMYAGPDLTEAQRKLAGERAARLEKAFKAVLPDGAWHHVEGDPGTAMGIVGRYADLVVMPCGAEEPLDALAGQPVETTILTAGVPVLAVPVSAVPADFGRDVLVAWNASREAARALHDALPVLAVAKAVTLVAGGEEAGQTLERGVALLAGHGIAAAALVIEAHDFAAALLAQAKHQGADGIVMGGYGHSRLREFIMGGATRSIIRRTHVPVLFAY